MTGVGAAPGATLRPSCEEQPLGFQDVPEWDVVCVADRETLILRPGHRQVIEDDVVGVAALVPDAQGRVALEITRANSKMLYQHIVSTDSDPMPHECNSRTRRCL